MRAKSERFDIADAYASPRKTVVVAITCPLTDELRAELRGLDVLLLERRDPLLLKLLIRHLKAALRRD